MKCLSFKIFFKKKDASGTYDGWMNCTENVQINLTFLEKILGNFRFDWILCYFQAIN